MYGFGATGGVGAAGSDPSAAEGEAYGGGGGGVPMHWWKLMAI